MSFLNPSLSLPTLLRLQYHNWLTTAHISPSISYQICKKILIDANYNQKQYQQKILNIDNFIQQIRAIPTLTIICQQWLNCIIFNTATLNTQYRQQLSSSLSLSLHSLHSSHSPQTSDITLNILSSLQQLWKQSMTSLFNISSIGMILQSIKQRVIINQSQHRNVHQVQYILFSTINYLCKQNNIGCKYRELIVDVLSYLSNCSCHCSEIKINDNIVHQVNILLFGSQKSSQNSQPPAKALQQRLSKNTNASLFSLATIIDSNYSAYQISRPLFIPSYLTGSQLMQQIITLLLSQYDKNYLFSQSMLEIQPIFQLFLTVVHHRYLYLYAHWLTIVHKYVNHQNSQLLSTDINNFLIALSTNYLQFTDLLKYIYSQLIKFKYSKPASLDILKKFILNRFLLAPTLYYSYSQQPISQDTLTQILNKIKTLFYPKKASTQNLQTQAQRIQTILANTISNTTSNKYLTKSPQLHLTNKSIYTKNVVYHTDQILIKDYQIIYNDLISNHLSDRTIIHPLNTYPHHQTQPNLKTTSSNSQELSFSFITPNTSKNFTTKQYLQNFNKNPPLQNKTKTIDHNNKQKININHIGIGNIASPISQKSRKTNISQRTQHQTKRDNQIAIIQQLITLRRSLGTALKLINQRKSRKAKQRQKRMIYFNKIHFDFQTKRRQIQQNASKLRTQIQLI